MEKEYYVYVIYRKDNDKPFYVGKGKGQRYGAWHNRNEGYRRIRDKYGAYHKIIFSNLEEEEALELEEQTILELGEFYELTNISSGGIHGNLGLKMDDNHRKKVSEAAKRQWDNPETREKIVASRRRSHATEEVRRRISEGGKGKVLSQEHKRNISKGMNDVSVKEKMSNSKAKYKDIYVYDLEDNLIGIFDNTRKAKDFIKENFDIEVKLSNIIGALKSKSKKSSGFKFKIFEN